MNIIHGDCLEELKKLEDNSIDAVVCDPPYGLSNTKPQQVADVLKAWVTGDTKVVPGLKKDSLEDAFVKALKRSAVTDSDDLDSEVGKEFVAFRVQLGAIPLSMFRPINLNDNPPSGEKEIDGDGMSFKVEHLLRNDGNTEGGEGVSGNIFRLRRRSNAPCSISREGDSARLRVSVWLGDNSFAKPEGSSGVMAGGATEVVAILSLDARRGTAEFLPTDSALPGDFILTRSGTESVGALTRTGGLPSVLESGEVSEVDASADGAGALDVVIGLPMGWHESHSSTSKGFMGKTWDGFVPPPAVWEECMRVLKPGGHMAVFAGARTQDLMGLSIRLAGFEIRDTLGWVYGSGFPKSMDIGKAIDKYNGNPLAFREFAAAYREAVAKSGLTHSAIDKALGIKASSCYWARDDHRGGMPPRHHWEKVRDLVYIPEELERLYDEAEREVVGKNKWTNSANHFVPGEDHTARVHTDITAPASDAAKQWDGWGTSLKPAIEPILLCRKPLDGTVAANVLAHGVGGLNIDACRVPSDEITGWGGNPHKGDGATFSLGSEKADARPVQGRFPANVLLDEHMAGVLDQMAPDVGNNGQKKLGAGNKFPGVYGDFQTHERPGRPRDKGGASRFFPVFKYQAKAPKKERPVIEREDGTKIQHPTVKPLTLLEWLVTLITPPGGVVLDPFAGSGTTLQAALNKGFTPIGIEQDADYIKLIEKRLEATCTTHKN